MQAGEAASVAGGERMRTRPAFNLSLPIAAAVAFIAFVTWQSAPAQTSSSATASPPSKIAGASANASTSANSPSGTGGLLRMIATILATQARNTLATSMQLYGSAY